MSDDWFDNTPRAGDPYWRVLQKEHSQATEQWIRSLPGNPNPNKLSHVLGVVGVGLGAVSTINYASSFIFVALSTIVGGLVGLGIGWSLALIPTVIGWAWGTVYALALGNRGRRRSARGASVCRNCGQRLYGQVGRCFKCGKDV
jgi:hypothetical protein